MRVELSFGNPTPRCGSDWGEFAGCGVDDVAGYADVGGHEGVMAYEVDCFGDGLRYFVEAVEPFVEVYAAVAHE